jgi:DNA-binding response OmpR family regulator
MSDLSILLVDDDAHVQKIITHYLKALSVDLIVAKDGYEALNLLSSSYFDLIILDYSMPYFNGLQILKKINLNKRHKNTPIIIMSSTNEKDDVVRFFDHGIADYIIKPPSKEEFLKRVTKALIKDILAH